mmetsp:Transcript_31820/g.69598  ORF Transcript_31820/g.69598 Transcript_31820/m.69598 type:complete len:183 (-) Transcript_31820:130-678(-)
MTNRPPLPGTYDPKDWKCPACKTLNFKKRMSCLACAAARPEGQREVLKDWRTGKKDTGDNVHADWTCRACKQFNLAAQTVCKRCQGPCPPKTAALGTVELSDGRTGRGSGHFDRDGEDARNDWNSDDEEFDEFGRKKRSSVAVSGKPARSGAMSERQRAALERLKSRSAGGGDAKRSRSRSR